MFGADWKKVHCRAKLGMKRTCDGVLQNFKSASCVNVWPALTINIINFNRKWKLCKIAGTFGGGYEETALRIGTGEKQRFLKNFDV